MGVAAGVRRHHHRAAQAPRLLVRLRARAVHLRRRLRARRDQGLRGPLREGLHPQGQLPRELVPALRHRDQRPRGRLPGHAGDAQLRALPGRGRQARDHRHDASRDDARRHGGGGASGRRAVHGRRRQDRHASAAGARAQDRRGRARRPGLRHRRPQDHPGSRPHRLRHRPHPRSGVRPGHRPGRPHHRGRRPLRRARGRSRRRARGRRSARAGSAREGGGLPAQRRHLRPVRHADRAADQRAVVHGHGLAQEAGHRRGPRRQP